MMVDPNGTWAWRLARATRPLCATQPPRRARGEVARRIRRLGSGPTPPAQYAQAQQPATEQGQRRRFRHLLGQAQRLQIGDHRSR